MYEQYGSLIYRGLYTARVGKLFCKGPDHKYLRLFELQLLHSALVVWKQPWMVHGQMGMAVFQKNFIYGH